MPEYDVTALLEATDPMRGVVPQVTGEGVLGGIQGTMKDRERKLAYWRRCMGCMTHDTDLGYIIVGPAPTEFNMFETREFEKAKHATLLDLNYLKPDPSIGKNTTWEMQQGGMRFRPLLRNGGIHEMPIAQMIEYNWHRLPAFRSAFPELTKVEDISCAYGCPTSGPKQRLFTTPQAYQAHVEVAHKDIQAPKAMGEAVKEAITYVGKRELDMDTITAMATALVTAMNKAK